MEALYSIQLPNPEYIEYVSDVIRMVLIQIMIQFLYFVDGDPFFTADFILLVIYIILGVSFYWLVFKKLVTFTSNNFSAPTK